MKYEKTGKVESGAEVARKEYKKEILRNETLLTVWFLIQKHKFGLTITWAVVMTILYIAPFLPMFLIDLVRG